MWDFHSLVFVNAKNKVNSETTFCLERWGMEAPPPIERMIDEMPGAGVCLVDHQQTSQLNPAIPQKRIIGVIDHHALQSETIITESPVFIDIRPWGSMSTVIYHLIHCITRVQIHLDSTSHPLYIYMNIYDSY
jgi:inorganic pyrophosphatase/exopolyphosphatase